MRPQKNVLFITVLFITGHNLSLAIIHNPPLISSAVSKLERTNRLRWHRPLSILNRCWEMVWAALRNSLCVVSILWQSRDAHLASLWSPFFRCRRAHFALLRFSGSAAEPASVCSDSQETGLIYRKEIISMHNPRTKDRSVTKLKSNTNIAALLLRRNWKKNRRHRRSRSQSQTSGR